MLHLLLLSLTSLAVASERSSIRSMQNLVTFGDSYTDESRLGFFISHNGQAPPPGMPLPESNATATGGQTWGRLVSEMTGAHYYDYAVSGATCSNEIISRDLPAIHGPFPSVIDYEVPAFEADVKFHTLYPDRQGDNTVYALWIGTNDLGIGAFLSDSQAPGTTISNYVACVWDVFDRIYKTGGRRFVLLNITPLDLAPLYAPVSSPGAGDNQYWMNKTLYNQTEYQHKMLEYSTNVNTMFQLGVPLNTVLERRWPGSLFSLFDVHSLWLNIRANPTEFLSAPANVTGFFHHCNAVNTSDCVNSQEPYPSFMWYDELHPTQQTEQAVAEEFIRVVRGESKYGKSYHG